MATETRICELSTCRIEFKGSGAVWYPQVQKSGLKGLMAWHGPLLISLLILASHSSFICCRLFTTASSRSLLLRNSALFVRNAPLIELISTPAQSSPTMPPVTSNTLPISTKNFASDGLCGRRDVKGTQSFQSCMSSRRGNAFSQGTDEVSRALISLSRADMELSKAEASVRRFEALWIKSAKITIAMLLSVMIYGLILIILALREEYVYKRGEA